jgi:hypothetical protein
MFARKSFQSESFSSKSRAGKATGKSKRSFRDQAAAGKKLERSMRAEATSPTVTR